MVTAAATWFAGQSFHQTPVAKREEEPGCERHPGYIARLCRHCKAEAARFSAEEQMVHASFGVAACAACKARGSL